VVVRTSVELAGDRLVIVRITDGDDQRASQDLLAEGRALRRLAGLAVPDVVAHEHDGRGGVRLVTTFTSGPLPISVDILALAAGTLAGAHGRGVHHGGLDHRSLAAGAGGELRIVGWRGSGTPADDVAGLGSLLLQLPGTRAAGRRATAADPDSRPTMRSLAEMLEGMRTNAPSPRAASPLEPGRSARATTRGDAATSSSAPRRRPRAPMIALLGGMAAACAVVAASPGGAAHPARDGAVTATELVHDGERFRVGGGDDVAVVGDWDCDGTETPAVLRNDGSVWTWPAWDEAPWNVGTARRATSIVASRDDNGCHRLDALDAAGRTVTIAGGSHRR
jgi:hypothetical protein